MKHIGRLALLLSTALVACGPELAVVPDTVHGRTFLSERVLEDEAEQTLIGGARLALSFDEHEPTSIGAFAGCNAWGGWYAIEGDILVVTNAASTLLGCTNGRGSEEDWYFTFLESRPVLELEGHGLVLEGGGMRIEYLDQLTASPDLALDGRTWKVESILEHGEPVHHRSPEPSTLVFAADENPRPEFLRGSMTFDTGCNTGSGTYSAMDDRYFEISDVTLTQTICEGDVARLEDFVLRVLDSEHANWEIALDRLWLAGEGVALELVATDG